MFFICFLFVLFSSENVFGLKKQICAYKDEVCLTQAMQQHIYAMLVGGVPGVEPSDPLHLDEVIVNLPDYVYKLREPQLVGLKDCQFKKLKLSHNDSYFDFEILCPHLNLQSNYQINKKDSEENGKSEVNYNNYFIVVKGEYGKKEDDTNTLYVQLMDYKIYLDLQAGVTYKYKSTVSDGKEKPDDYYKGLEELSRQTVMEAFITKFMLNLKAFLNAIPLQEIRFRYI